MKIIFNGDREGYAMTDSGQYQLVYRSRLLTSELFVGFIIYLGRWEDSKNFQLKNPDKVISETNLD